LGGIVRVWDLRSGRTITPLLGHFMSVTSVDWSPNGFELATASLDRSIRVWDLRKSKSLYIIPAHSKLISNVKYEPTFGRFLISSSFDNTIKFFTNSEFKNVKTIKAQSDKVMGLDVSRDSDIIVTSGYDKTFKIFKKVEDDIMDLNF
jgi:U4/U6 small nuclear ribonucleoprotein PRP4